MAEFAEYVGARTAAKQLGISRGLMYRILKNGVIEPVRTDIGLMVRASDVQDLARRRLSRPMAAQAHGGVA